MTRSGLPVPACSTDGAARKVCLISSGSETTTVLPSPGTLTVNIVP